MLLFWKITSFMLSLFKKLFFCLPLTAFVIVIGLILAVLGLMRILLSIAFSPLFIIVFVVVLLVKSSKSSRFYNRN